MQNILIIYLQIEINFILLNLYLLLVFDYFQFLLFMIIKDKKTIIIWMNSVIDGQLKKNFKKVVLLGGFHSKVFEIKMVLLETTKRTT